MESIASHNRLSSYFDSLSVDLTGSVTATGHESVGA
jgi:hypothetical protein